VSSEIQHNIYEKMAAGSMMGMGVAFLGSVAAILGIFLSQDLSIQPIEAWMVGTFASLPCGILIGAITPLIVWEVRKSLDEKKNSSLSTDHFYPL
jgi:hypothetical protein